MLGRVLGRREVLRGAAAVCAGCAVASCGGGGGAALPGAEAKGSEVAKLTDVPVGTAVLVTSKDGAKLVLTRTSETEVSGWSAICPHSGCSVAPSGTQLVCPCHGSEFDAATGGLKKGPADKDLTAVAVAIQGDAVVLA